MIPRCCFVSNFGHFLPTLIPLFIYKNATPTPRGHFMSQKLGIFCPYSDTKTHRNTIKHTPNPKHAQFLGIFCPFCYHFCHEFTRLERLRRHALSHTTVNVRKNTNEQTSSHAAHILYKMTLANPALTRVLEKL